MTYSVATQPDPIEVGTPLSLTITASNQTGANVTCTQIIVTVPVGTNAADLIATAQIDTVPPAADWGVKQDGGQVIFTPPGGSIVVKGEGLVFVLAMTANNQAGSANVLIDESASNPANPAGVRSYTWVAAKYPVDFTLSALTAVPVTNTNIPHGKSATLTWTATGAGVTCTLSYVPDNSGNMVTDNVPNSPTGGSYTTRALTRNGEVDFLLTAQMTPADQDQPLTKTASLPITVATLGLTLYAEPPVVGVNGLARVRWVAVNADHCVDEDDGSTLPAVGEKYVLLQQQQTFNITAVGADGQTLPQQLTIQVNPNIVANAPGQNIVAPWGAGGQSATRYMAGRSIEGPVWVWSPPSAGGAGGDADLTIALPPLDTSGGGQVIPIALTAGPGGGGGSGEGQFGDAPGGNGGNATLNLSWDPNATTTAQYLITVTAGAGGGGGAVAGTASATVDGYAVVLP
ncbi:hypothetical protein OF829_16670 [Sphingomonas sp. LB-2]|nr:hypothetical protein [Sphingomonas caeni]